MRALWCLSIRTDAEVGSCWTWLWQLTDCWAAGIGYLLLSLSLSFPTLWWASLQPPQLFYQVSMKTLSAHYKKKKKSILSVFLHSVGVATGAIKSSFFPWKCMFGFCARCLLCDSLFSCEWFQLSAEVLAQKVKLLSNLDKKNGMPSNCMNIRNATYAL